MKHLQWLAAALTSAGALALAVPAAAQTARFDWVHYEGTDPAPAVGPGQFRNPILAGFYPDPSITRVGNDFYLVNSTFSWFPGIPVWHSRDLVTWRQIGNAIDRPGQLDFAKLGMSRGVFAPAISYHDGRFFIITTCVDCGGNFVITATNPAGAWSDPTWLPTVEGIDPSLFFDADGTAWIVNNRGPAGPPLYEGHRALWIEQFDPKTMKMMGNAKMIVDGGVDITAKPVWIEGPHIFQHQGKYYLTAAEGGTSVNHSQVVFRADSVTGPYRPAPPSVNPILTQRDLDPARPRPITSAGHADLVELADGSWWATFLATRPYEGDLYNTGRETFLLPVTWRDGWPTILERGRAIPEVATAPRLPSDRRAVQPNSGSFSVRDEFDGDRLAQTWVMMRVPPKTWWQVKNGALLVDAQPAGIGDHAHPAFVGRRQQHADAAVSTEMAFRPVPGAEAGLAAVQDDDHFLSIGVVRAGKGAAIRVATRTGASDPATGRTIATVPVPVATGSPLRLRIHARGGRYDFSYAVGNGAWQVAARDVDGTNLSTARAGGFTGTLIGPFARAAP